MSRLEIIHTFIYSASFLALFGITEILYKRRVHVEFTRKTAHVGTGLITLTFPLFLETHWSVLILTISFVGILYFSNKYKILKSINGIRRKSKGSVLYPIIIYMTYWIYTFFDDVLFFYLPILILAVCDPVAAYTGRKWPRGVYKVGTDTKTMTGSTFFFISCVLLTLIFTINLRESWVEIICVTLFIGLFTTVAEGLSQKGWDNLFIPLTVTVTLLVSEYIFHF